MPYLVGVPQADGAAQRQLSHQQVVHPPEGKLEVLHLTLHEVTVNVLWRTDNTQMEAAASITGYLRTLGLARWNTFFFTLVTNINFKTTLLEGDQRADEPRGLTGSSQSRNMRTE